MAGDSVNQFTFEIFSDGRSTSYRLTCTFCAASIDFDRGLHKRAYMDRHEQQCKPVRVAGEDRCTESRGIYGPGGFRWVQCVLAQGHPQGPEFKFFSDFEGHIWPDPKGK